MNEPRIAGNVNLSYNFVLGLISVSPALTLSPALEAGRSYVNRLAFFVFERRLMNGCKHNLERIIQYPKMELMQGLYILLVCPHGCEPIPIQLKSNHPEKRNRV